MSVYFVVQAARLYNVVISDEDVCCSVLFETLAGVSVLSVM